MKIHKIKSSISNYIGVLLFNKRLPISYCLFNFFFNNLIVNKKNLNHTLKTFNDKGYTKIDSNFQKVDEINKNITIKEEFPNRVEYDLSQNIKTKIIKNLNDKLKDLLNNFKIL